MSRPFAFWLALAVAGLAAALTTRFNTFVAWGTDQAAYIETAQRWSERRLFKALPLHGLAWAPADEHLVQYGFRPGTVPGTDVPIYPSGLPVFMAAAIRFGGPLAAYVVPPLSAAILLWSVYLLGSAMAGSWNGLLTAALLAMSPITLGLAVQPLSDLPAAALWAVAWVMSLRRGTGAAMASGAAAAGAIMMRPNLAPLVLVVAGILLASSEPRARGGVAPWLRVMVFTSAAAAGVLMVLWWQRELYGGPFTSGYPQVATFYRLEHIVPSLKMYPRILTGLHTPLIFLGLLAGPLLGLPRVRASVPRRARMVVVSATAFALLTYVLLAPYHALPDPLNVRLVMPAVTALYILFAGLLVWIVRVLAPRSRGLAAAALIPALVVALYRTDVIRFALSYPTHTQRVRLAGLYLKDALPGSGAVLVLEHGTPLAHYTGSTTLRFGGLSAEAFDRTVHALERSGYRPVIVLDQSEQHAFRAHYSASQFGALDWPARAEFLDLLQMTCWDLAHRDRYRRGERWATDVIRAR